jgi:hypothetical protein
MPTRRITVAFSGRGPIVYVRDRRRTAIRPRKRDGPCDIHPYHVQVRLSSPRLRASPPLGPSPSRHTILLLADSKNIQHRVLAIRAHRLPRHALRHVGAQCARRGADEGHFFWRDRAHGDATAPRGGWYSRVRSEEPMHVIGNEEDEED